MNYPVSSAVLMWLWAATWQSALLAAVVLLTTRLLRRWLTPQARQLLWLLVFLRLVMPALPGSRLSAFSWISAVPQAEHHVQPVAILSQRVVEPNFTSAKGNPKPALTASMPMIAAKAPSFDWASALLIIWLTGSAAIFAKVIVSNALFTNRLKRQTPCEDLAIIELVANCCRQLGIQRNPAVVTTDLVKTPALYGAIKPRLLLPLDLTLQVHPNELRLIILHELEHLRRHHLKVDWLLIAICSLHWFNPIAWRAHRQIRAARELICDRAVLAGVDDDLSHRYGMAMLALATHIGRQNRGIPLAAFAEAQNDLKQRIEAIAARRKQYIFGLGTLVAIAIALFLLTRPAPLTATHDGPTISTSQPAISQLGPEQPPSQATTRESFDDIVKYPTNWPDLQAMRKRIDNAEHHGVADQEVIAKLDVKIPELKFDKTPFRDAIDSLRKISLVPIFVNWRAIEDAGVNRDVPITAYLRDVKLSKAIDLILRDVGAAKAKLASSVDEGVLTISTRDDLSGNVITNVYDIRDLLVPVKPTDDKRRQLLIREIIRLIQDTVAADTWKEQGGKIGSIRELAGQLIIIQTPENHRQIITLVEQLRETRAIQISIETILFEVSTEKGNQLWQQLSPASTTQLSKYGMAMAAIVQPQADPFRYLWLDDQQFLTIRAQSDAVINAPRLTLFNGQTATLEIKQSEGLLKFELTPSLAANRNYAAISYAMVGMKQNIKLEPQSIMVPDGANAMVRLDHIDRNGNSSADKQLLLLLKPTLILQRQMPKEQFPTVGHHPDQP